jgi:hypothetical protein
MQNQDKGKINCCQILHLVSMYYNQLKSWVIAGVRSRNLEPLYLQSYKVKFKLTHFKCRLQDISSVKSQKYSAHKLLGVYVLRITMLHVEQMDSHYSLDTIVSWNVTFRFMIWVIFTLRSTYNLYYSGSWPSIDNLSA